MSFKIDYSQASDKIQPGTYEAVMVDWTPKETKTGSKYIELDFIVRNDINQAHKNSHIWHKVWAKRGTTDYTMWAIITVAKAMRIPDGTVYTSLQDMLNALKNGLCRVIVRHNDGGYVETAGFEPTQFQQNNHQYQAAGQMPGQPVAYNQDNLPF